MFPRKVKWPLDFENFLGFSLFFPGENVKKFIFWFGFLRLWKGWAVCGAMEGLRGPTRGRASGRREGLLLPTGAHGTSKCVYVLNAISLCFGSSVLFVSVEKCFSKKSGVLVLGGFPFWGLEFLTGAQEQVSVCVLNAISYIFVFRILISVFRWEVFTGKVFFFFF